MRTQSCAVWAQIKSKLIFPSKRKQKLSWLWQDKLIIVVAVSSFAINGQLTLRIGKVRGRKIALHFSIPF